MGRSGAARSWLLISLACGGCGGACEGGEAVHRGPAGASAAAKEAPPFSVPAPSSEPEPEPAPGLVSAANLAAFLPDEVHGFIAEVPAQPNTESNAVTGTQLPTATRIYRRDDTYLRIHVVEATHVPHMRATIAKTMGMYRQSEESTVIGRAVQGHPASIQWRGGTARAGVLVDDRIVVSISVTPAQDPEPAETIANKLDLTQLSRLIEDLPR